MAASADRIQDSKLPGPSRTPSGSPLPTPTSSQTRIHDIRVRTRKVSQTAHDDVDMLDVTDPWGANWHHQSPYDLGTGHPQASPESETPPVPRPRRMSLTTAGSRHKTVTPSPLSQSTSAVHLSIDPATIHLPRRLSKHRKPFRGLFTGSMDSGHPPRHTSEPPTPLDTSDRRTLKRGSTVGPSASIPSSLIDKKDKRSSMLGRLVKRFSVMRRSDTTRSPTKTPDDSHPHRAVHDRTSMDVQPLATSAPASHKPHSQRAEPSDASKRRVPPPSLQESSTQPSVNRPTPKDDEIASFITDAEAPSVRRLTIANPDEPSSSDANTPVENTVPLPQVPESQSFPETPVPSPKEELTRDEIPLSSSPAPLHSPVEDSHIYQSRLSTIMSASVGHPGTSVSPALPDLPPPTPGISPGTMPSENSLPPTPVTTGPPSPAASAHSSALPPLPPPSIRSQTRDGLSNAMSPSTLSAFHASLPEIDDSPLSRASMVVNPPTPLTSTVMIPKSPAFLPMPAIQQETPQSSEETKTSRDHSPTKKDGSQREKSSSSSSKVRRTETFKLVRSLSGNVQTVGEGFVAEGEHWEVVESPIDESRKSKRDRRRSKEADGGSMRKKSNDSKRHDRHGGGEDDSDPQKGREHDRHRRSINGRHHADGSGSSQAPQASSTNGVVHRSEGSERRRSSNKLVKSHSAGAAERSERRRSNGKDVQRAGSGTVRSTQTPVIYTLSAPATQPSLSASSSRRERKVSLTASTRPSSDFQSVADLNTLKAKEAWDMERLWKGRSMMYGPDGTTLVSNRPTIGSDSRPSTIMTADIQRATSITSMGDMARTSPVPTAHGSSHTYFMVQTPYQGQPNGSSYSPGATSPVIYASPGPVQPSSPQRDYSKHYRTFAEPVPFPSTSLTSDSASQRISNPLPEPPRLSSYRPSPLPPSIAGSGDGPSSPEYWSKIAGVTSTH
ncbi:unnamed protein product [Somion occarium]